MPWKPKGDAVVKGSGKVKTKEQLAAELKVVKNSRTTEAATSIVQALIKYGTVAWIAHEAYLAIVVLSGKHTFADIGIRFLAEIPVSIGIAWVLAVGAVLYGLRQNKLRKDTVERLQNRIQSLEKTIDPGRSSSQLTTRGDTRPEDLP